ncbi:MAG: hypothetical protein QRY74_00200 [Chlamydia sp.]
MECRVESACGLIENSCDCSSKRIDLMKHAATSQQDIHTKIKELLLLESLDYVLITCRKLPEKGKKLKSQRGQQMEVELSFEGDPDLASYLVHGAQEYFNDTTVFHENQE